VAEGLEEGEREAPARLAVSERSERLPGRVDGPAPQAPGAEGVSETNGEEVVRAAGGVVVRPGEHGPEVLLVHRPRYDDWSFPKGKRDGDESDEETACREVLEETGLACMLGRQLGEARYHDSRQRPKVVRYWLMRPDPDDPGPGFTPNHEVDQLRWCTVPEAAKMLSYAHDRALLSHASEGLAKGLGSTP
jgi:8-oxo-dGTP diphosphatase